ncbi:hypothetical protein GF380_05140 [Candidatus Uhrbacteria bacterium]|nr:hypothetical protein [Candidatus Uhrbacteria bacterium]MBD3284416.1 hypothetical protein [Candidatus Uhrbacteria bacterium]
MVTETRSEPTQDNDIAIQETSAVEKHFQCGHTASPFLIRTEEGEIGVPEDRYFPDCAIGELQRITVRCGCCDRLIYPGQPVWLSHKTSDQIPPHAVVLKESVTELVQCVISCLNSACCPCGGLVIGHWTQDRRIQMLDGEHKDTIPWEERPS